MYYIILYSAFSDHMQQVFEYSFVEWQGMARERILD